MMNISKLNPYNKTFLLILSFCLVAFGQPAWNGWISILSGLVGFALFWRVLLDVPEKGYRFCIGMGWYAGIQIVQLAWMISHPFSYIYGVLFFCAYLMGFQFGLISMLITPNLFTRFYRLLLVAGLWALLEWSRLFVLSGLPFNPVGLTLTGSIYSMQFASIGGVFLLSFWVVITNLSLLRMWLYNFRWSYVAAAIVISFFPYVFGFIHLSNHLSKQEKENATISALLVQPADPIEESMGFKSADEARQFVLDEWKHMLELTSGFNGSKIDLIVFPEYAVPYGTYYPVFSYSEVKKIFKDLFGDKYLSALPPLEDPYAANIDTHKGPQWLVSNAFFPQALANIFQADVIVGLEDSIYVKNKKDEAYSSAFHFSPNNQLQKRYEKRVLLPMGEYIPFEFCRDIAAKYGIQGSFTCGTEAKVFNGKILYSPSICYEEAFGHLMREGRAKGAEIIVNLTNDGWYPNSMLPQQHFDHARLRTVENGIPLARACNTGLTGAVDSLGRIVATLGDGSVVSQSTPGALRVEIPTYHYATLYTWWGDFFVIGMSSIFIFIGAIDWLRR
ncbi:MAG: apolipoprotein N-acyltransferase [Parachlamydiaceae bacterium]|nr:apolipoprotein N-acyltransferase [Parachlamydiaceae bacterium]